MKLTEYGMREWLIGGICTILLIALCLTVVFYWKNPSLGYSLAGLVCFSYFCFAAFFRDPYRKIPADENVLVSPADGVVKDIELVKGAEENEFFEKQDIVRMGIYISFFDVYINRAPCCIEISDRKYRKGKNSGLKNRKASEAHEMMTLFCNAYLPEKKFPLILRQISGAAEKRIVCAAEPGSRLEKGDKFGMVKFGTRVELYLPAEQWLTMKVKIGDRVYAGETVIARVNMDMKPKTKK